MRMSGARSERTGTSLVAMVCMSALLATMLPQPVQAADADAPLTTLFDLSGDDTAAREIGVDVMRALKRTKQVRFRDVDETLNLGGEEMQVSSVKSGDGLMKAGLAKMQKKQYADAAEDFDNAVGNYLTGYAHLPDTTIVAKAMGQLAAAQLLSGEAKPAAATFQRSVQIDPKVELDFTEYPPQVQKLYDDQRKAVKARQNVDFEIKTVPPNAKVTLNGRYFGLSPVYVKSLAGEQFIAVAKNGWARKSHIAIVRADDSVVIEMEPAKRKAAFETTKERLADVFAGAVEPSDLSEAEGLVATPFAIVLRATGTREKMKVEMALANLAGRQVVNRITREIPWMKRDKDTIDKLVDDLLKAPEIPIQKAPVDTTKSVFKTWWFWTVVGVVAAGSVGAYMVANQKETTVPPFQPGQGGLLIQF